MISAGEVGAVFTIKDEASPVLRRLMDQFNALEMKLGTVKESFAGIKFPSGLNRSINNMSSAIDKVGVAAEKAATKTDSAFKAIDASVDRTAERVAALKREMTGIGRGVGGSGGGGGGGGGRGRGRGGMFHGGMHQSLPGGPSISTGSGNDGFWEAIAGYVGLNIIKDVIGQGGALETEKKMLRDKLGSRGSEADIDSAVGYATKYASDPMQGVIGTTIAENLKGIRELMSVTPNLEAAEKLYPGFMQASKVLEELSGEKADQTMPILAKALENLGGGINPITHELDPARMQNAVGEAIKTIIAGGGFIDANQLFGLAKQAGGMGRITTNMGEFFDQAITALIDMGGQRTGTAMAALGRQFLGDKMTVQTASALEDLGIMPKGGWRKGGGTGIIMNPGMEIRGVGEIKDPDKGLGEWFKDVVAPAIKAKFGDNMSVADIMQESYKIFGQQTGQRLALMYLANEAQRDRDVQIKNAVDPKSVYAGMVNKDYAANLSDLSASITSFEQVIGGPSTEAAISGMQKLSAGIRALTNVASKNPDADKAIIEYGAGGFAALMANGISKFFGGPTIGGISGLAASGAEALLGSAAAPFAAMAAALGLVSASKPNQTDPLTKTGDALGVYERAWRSQQERLADPEAKRGFEMLRRDARSGPGGGLPVVNVSPPNVQTNVNADVHVNASLDGIMTALAAKVVSLVVSSVSRVTSGISGFDGQEHPVYPDHAGMGHH